MTRDLPAGPSQSRRNDEKRLPAGARRPARGCPYLLTKLKTPRIDERLEQTPTTTRAMSSRAMSAPLRFIGGRSETAVHRRVREPAFESCPTLERSPDWLILGARPA